MGMESYSLTFLVPNVKIVRDKEYWKLEGLSNITLEEVENYFNTLDIMKSNEGVWEYDNCIEMYLKSTNNFFQGIEIKGCLAYFDEGMEECFNFRKIFINNIITVDTYVLNELVSMENYEKFYNEIKKKYYEKIALFKQCYKDISIKTTCGGFYIDTKLPIKQQAKQAFELRNQFRTQARELMSDRTLADSLNITDPNLEWEEVIQKQIKKGFTGDDIYKEIVESAQRSRKSVNESLGLGK